MEDELTTVDAQLEKIVTNLQAIVDAINGENGGDE